jgi:hypothetical protein
LGKKIFAVVLEFISVRRKTMNVTINKGINGE